MSIMDLFVILVVVSVAGAVCTVPDWLEAKSKEAKERARKLKLENDKLEMDIAAAKRGEV